MYVTRSSFIMHLPASMSSKFTSVIITAVLAKQKWKTHHLPSGTPSHQATRFGFVLYSFFIIMQYVDLVVSLSWRSVCVTVSFFFFFIHLKCVPVLVFVATAFDWWIPPWGSIKCIVSFHLISSHHLSYGLLHENINNVRCRWVCLQVANI